MMPDSNYNLPTILENSALRSSLDLFLGMLPTNNRTLATEMFTFSFFPGFISNPSSCRKNNLNNFESCQHFHFYDRFPRNENKNAKISAHACSLQLSLKTTTTFSHSLSRVTLSPKHFLVKQRSYLRLAESKVQLTRKHMK